MFWVPYKTVKDSLCYMYFAGRTSGHVSLPSYLQSGEGTDGRGDVKEGQVVLRPLNTPDNDDDGSVVNRGPSPGSRNHENVRITEVNTGL